MVAVFKIKNASKFTHFFTMERQCPPAAQSRENAPDWRHHGDFLEFETKIDNQSSSEFPLTKLRQFEILKCKLSRIRRPWHQDNIVLLWFSNAPRLGEIELQISVFLPLHTCHRLRNVIYDILPKLVGLKACGTSGSAYVRVQRVHHVGFIAQRF